MINKLKTFYQKHYIYLLSFFIPFTIITFYFGYRNMFPFGNSSILTVDLGQQYIDFFAYFRRTLLNHNFSEILYSFSNGYGGEMIGIWAYYLMSPLNLILLIFPAKFINAAVLLITIIKYALSGLTFSIFLKNQKVKNNILIITLSIAYSMNGWMIANQLNIMWLDGVILLPLIIMGIDKILNNKTVTLFIVSYSGIIIINYYIAYMISIFIAIYVIFSLYIKHINFKSTLIKFGKITTSIIVSILLSSFILIPNLIELKSGKASYTLLNMKTTIEYNPLFMITKLFNGSFNFSQMPSGYPNIFVGSIAIVGFLAYFGISSIGLKKKIAVLVVTTFLLFSMVFQPLDLIWHALQFPIWYPYRFSFIVCFWIIYIAAIGLNNLGNTIKIKTIIVSALIIIPAFIYTAIEINKFNYMNITKYLISLSFIAISFLIIHLSNKRSIYYFICLLIISVGDMGMNMFTSLNSISYVSNDDYIRYTSLLNSHIDPIKKSDSSFYRISKDFYRTRDDSIESNFFGGSAFSSTIQKDTTDFNSNIGSAYTSGSIDYSNGTLITDSMLNFKYFINTSTLRHQYSMIQKSSNRNDILKHDLQRIDVFQTYKSNSNLPVIYATSSKVFSSINAIDPIDYQNKMVKNISLNNTTVFKDINQYTITSQNTNKITSINNQVIKKNNLLKEAVITISYNGQKNKVPYLLIPSNMNQNNASITMNNEELYLPDKFDSSFVVSLPNNKRNQIKIKLNTNQLFTGNFKLVNLNFKTYLNDTKYIRDQNNHINFKNNTFKTDIITTNKNNSISTSIPYSRGWHLTIDGKNYPIKKIDNQFIGADNLTSGNHKLVLSFYPSGLNLGVIISLITLIILIIIWMLRHKKRES